MWTESSPEVPIIQDDESFANIVRKLSFYFAEVIEAPHSFEELRTLPIGRSLVPLIRYLSDNTHHPAIVSALLLVFYKPVQMLEMSRDSTPEPS